VPGRTKKLENLVFITLWSQVNHHYDDNALAKVCDHYDGQWVEESKASADMLSGVDHSMPQSCFKEGA